MKTASILLIIALFGTFALSAQTLRTGYESPVKAGRVPEVNLKIDPIFEGLQSSLYDLGSHYHTVQQLQWNLTGPLFISLHQLYGEIYEGIAVMIDEQLWKLRSTLK